MKIISIIPIKDRNKCRCHFCGETRSVKYITEIISTPRNRRVFCCNKCILTAKEKA